jgi:hypothetical protein
MRKTHQSLVCPDADLTRPQVRNVVTACILTSDLRHCGWSDAKEAAIIDSDLRPPVARHSHNITCFHGDH